MTIAIDSNHAIDAFLSEHQTIKALPENTTRIIRMANDPECNTTQLLKIIAQDAALAGQIMKSVNSAFYSLPKKITTLDRAVSFMGLRAVKEVTLSASLASLVKPIPLGQYDARDLWDHSVGVAIVARELAIKAKNVDPEEAFLAGMLHDIGLLMIAQADPKRTKDLFIAASAGPRRFTEFEQERFEFNHAELGSRLATSWEFPPLVQSVIRWHHLGGTLPAEHARFCLHIFACDNICAQAGVGCPLTCNGQSITEADYRAAGLDPALAAEISTKLPVLLRLYTL